MKRLFHNIARFFARLLRRKPEIFVIRSFDLDSIDVILGPDGKIESAILGHGQIEPDDRGDGKPILQPVVEGMKGLFQAMGQREKDTPTPSPSPEFRGGESRFPDSDEETTD